MPSRDVIHRAARVVAGGGVHSQGSVPYYTVRSATSPREEYDVFYVSPEKIICTCQAGREGHKCHHALAVLFTENDSQRHRG